MTLDSSVSVPPTSVSPAEPQPASNAGPQPAKEVQTAEEVQNLQVCFRTEAGQLRLVLPPETATSASGGLGWPELLQQLQQRLNAGQRFWQPQTEVQLLTVDRLLDARQFQLIADALADVQLQLKRISTQRRQTAVAAAAAGYSVDQEATSLPMGSTTTTPAQALADPLYLQATVRSGVEIRHPGTVVIMGDLNPGGTVVADGDILIWGRLRGVAHAGAKGNRQCRIMTLKMEPTQLRIADQVARAPAVAPTEFHPEVAYIATEGIRIAKASDFSKQDSLTLFEPKALT